MSEEIKDEVIEDEMDFVAVETEEEKEFEPIDFAIPEEEESFISKFKSSAKKKAPKVAKIAAIGALTIAGFVLGVKVGKKGSESDSDDDGDYIDCDGYESTDDYLSDDTNE